MSETQSAPPAVEQAEAEKKLTPFFEAIAQEDAVPFIESLSRPPEWKTANLDRLSLYALIGYQEVVAATLGRPLTDDEQDQTRSDFMDNLYNPTWMDTLEIKYPLIKDSLRSLFTKFKEHTQRSLEAVASS